MISLSLEIFSKCCRCCLSQNVPLQPLFNASLGEMLRSFVTFTVLPGDEYPQQICKRCILKLSGCFTFRQTVLTSYQILKNTIDSSHSSEEQTNRDQEDFEDKTDVTEQKVIKKNMEEYIEIEAGVTSADIAQNDVIKQEIFIKENLDTSNKDNTVNETSFTNPVVDHNYMIEQEIIVNENIDISNEDILYEVSFTNSDIVQYNMIKQENLDICNEDIVNDTSYTGSEIDETGQETPINENIAITKENDANTNVPMQEECSDLYDLNTEGVDNSDSLLYKEEHSLDCDENSNTKMATNTSSDEALKNGGCGGDTTQCNVCTKRKLPVCRHRTDGMRYLCTYCGKVFKWRTSLCRHVRLHKGNNLHVCKYCTKQFKTHHYLQAHISIHTGATYKCEKCNKKFTQKCSLTKHEMLHTNIKPYKCEYCVHSFRDKSTLLAHLRRHTGEKPYKCPQCQKMYMWKTSYKVHLARHSRQKNETGLLTDTANDRLLKGSDKNLNLNLMFLCMLCDARFPTQALLKEHSESHSKDLSPSQSECKIIYIVNK